MSFLRSLILGPRRCRTCKQRTRRHLWRDAAGQCMPCAIGPLLDLWAPLS